MDAGYYHFPSEKWIGGPCAQVPEHFRFGFKITDEITIKEFPNLPRFGSRAGTANSNFLNAVLFVRHKQRLHDARLVRFVAEFGGMSGAALARSIGYSGSA